MTWKAGRPVGAAGFLVVPVVLVAVVVGFLVWRHDHQDYVVPPSSTAVSQAQPQPTRAAAALAAFQSAVAARSGGATPLLRSLVVNARALEVADFTLRYVDEAGPVAADGSWTGAVDVTYRFAGYDPVSAHEEIDVRFGPDGQIAGFGGGSDPVPLWLTGSLQVRRTSETLVLAAADADRFATMATSAVQVVDRVFPAWHGPLVLEVPQDEAGFDALLGQSAGTGSGVAAVTEPVGGGPVHVLVNAAVFGNLENRGAQVVLSHEATHVATHATGNAHRPPWLTEGFADYVALRDVHLPLSTTAGQILRQVRQQGPPDHLPGTADFNAQSDTFGTEYEAAWFACRLLAQLGGEQRLVTFYDQVGAGGDVDATLRQVFGFGLAEFTQRWDAALRQVAR